ncbi:MAG: RsmB/NOP family class I SAM-dependent RNA methyltransferase [bacterium]
MSHPSKNSPQSPQLLALRSYLQFKKQRDWQSIRQAEFSPSEDNRHQTHLLQGVLRHHRWLQAEVQDRCRLPWSKLQDVLQGILLIGAYELIFLRSSKQHHAIHQAVELVRMHRLEARTGLVNAILRQLQRDLQSGLLQPAQRSLATRTSHPDWMVERWIQSYGVEATEQICEANNLLPNLTLAPSQVEHIVSIRQQLEAIEIDWEAHPVFPELTVLQKSQGVWNTAMAKEGMIYAQDASSYAFCQAIRPFLEGTILDVCSAPGGKGLQLSQNYPGQFLLNDVSASRLKKVRQNLQRLNLAGCMLQSDGTQLPFPSGSMDGILLDVPCSSTGTIRKSPDIKWVENLKSLLRQTALQEKLLKEAARVVRKGGWIAYSTCSLEPEETQLPLQLAEELGLQPIPWRELPGGIQETQKGFWQLLPSRHWMGFSAAILMKS